MWTPYQIEIILHHHVSTERFARSEYPIYSHTVDHLHKLGVLYYDNGVSRTTPKGQALVNMWRNTPLPVTIHIDPRTRAEIGGDE